MHEGAVHARSLAPAREVPSETPVSPGVSGHPRDRRRNARAPAEPHAAAAQSVACRGLRDCPRTRTRLESPRAGPGTEGVPCEARLRRGAHSHGGMAGRTPAPLGKCIPPRAPLSRLAETCSGAGPGSGARLQARCLLGLLARNGASRPWREEAPGPVAGKGWLARAWLPSVRPGLSRDSQTEGAVISGCRAIVSRVS